MNCLQMPTWGGDRPAEIAEQMPVGFSDASNTVDMPQKLVGLFNRNGSTHGWIRCSS